MKIHRSTHERKYVEYSSIGQLFQGWFSRIFLHAVSCPWSPLPDLLTSLFFCRRQSPTSYLSSRCAISFCPFWGTAGWEESIGQARSCDQEEDENTHCSCWLAKIYWLGAGSLGGPMQEAFPSLHLPKNVTITRRLQCHFIYIYMYIFNDININILAYIYICYIYIHVMIYDPTFVVPLFLKLWATPLSNHPKVDEICD